MYLTLEEAQKAGHKITRDAFQKHGKKIKLLIGVKNYFDKINNYANKKDILLEHYIISSGLKEIIEGTGIYDKFKYVFASEFYYDENGVAKWPAVAFDYTNKTQYLYRINKGIINIWNNKKINKYVPKGKHYIPFKHIIYIGDGETDVPAMKMVNYKGGYSIAVYDQRKKRSRKKKSPKEICIELLKYDRAKLIATANYKMNSVLFQIIKLIIDKIHNKHLLKRSLSKLNIKRRS